MFLAKEAQGEQIIKQWKDAIQDDSSPDLDMIIYEEKKRIAGFALQVYHASLGKMAKQIGMAVEGEI